MPRPSSHPPCATRYPRFLSFLSGEATLDSFTPFTEELFLLFFTVLFTLRLLLGHPQSTLTVLPLNSRSHSGGCVLLLFFLSLENEETEAQRGPASKGAWPWPWPLLGGCISSRGAPRPRPRPLARAPWPRPPRPCCPLSLTPRGTSSSCFTPSAWGGLLLTSCCLSPATAVLSDFFPG